MRHVTQRNSKNIQAAKRIMVFALLLCFFMASLLSEIYIFTHAEHEHDHDGTDGRCTVCIHIQDAENLLKLIGAAVKSASYAAAGLFSLISIIYSVSFLKGFQTLVALKIRLNN